MSVPSVESLLGMGASSVGSRLALANSVAAGLPVKSLERLADAVAPGDVSFKFRLVPKATLERRARTTRRLNVDEGDRVARLAKVFAAGLDVYRDPDTVRQFLGKPHAMLDGQKPLDFALATSPGADIVINILGRAAYGAAV